MNDNDIKVKAAELRRIYKKGKFTLDSPIDIMLDPNEMVLTYAENHKEIVMLRYKVPRGELTFWVEIFGLIKIKMHYVHNLSMDTISIYDDSAAYWTILDNALDIQKWFEKNPTQKFCNYNFVRQETLRKEENDFVLDVTDEFNEYYSHYVGKSDYPEIKAYASIQRDMIPRYNLALNGKIPAINFEKDSENNVYLVIKKFYK